MMLLAISALMVACEGHSGAEQKPATIECIAGDNPTISISAESEWHLSSDAVWCKILNLTERVQDLAGKAGNHTITLAITDEGLEMTYTEARLTLREGGHSRVVAIVKRSAEEPRITILNAEGKSAEAIELGFDSYTPFTIEANFRFAVVDAPEWVAFDGGSVSGNANRPVAAGARIVPNGSRERYPITKDENHTITFGNETGSIAIAVPVTFAGMSARDITIVSDAGTTYGWEVALDGVTKRHRDEFSGTVEEYDGEFSYAIAAREDKFEVVCLEMVIERGIPTYTLNPAWIHFADGTITIDPATETRYGLVMAFPVGIYDEIKSDIKGSIFEMDDATGIDIETLKYDYMAYTMLEFVQKDFRELGPYEGMYIYHSLTAYEIPATEYTNEAIKAEYGAEVAYTCPFVNTVEGKKPGIIIDPRIEGWNTSTQESGRATAELYYKGNRLKISEGEYYMGENKDEVMAIHLTGPVSDFTEEVYVLFKLDGKVEKLLVVTPPTK